MKFRFKQFVYFCGIVGIGLACQQRQANQQEKEEKSPSDYPQVEQESFGTIEGKEVTLFTLQNSQGMKVKITNYGGIISQLWVPDKEGQLEDVVLGFDHLEDYLKGSPYFGAIVGRYGNRIAKGQFELDGELYSLATNDGSNHLHGGKKGFDKVLWDAEYLVDEKNVKLLLSYHSIDGEEGYPGNLSVKVVYTLTDENALKIEYYATTDKKTIVNLTNHSYFNLKGAGKGDILEHQLTIYASKFSPVNQELIPTGELQPVEGTAFDFRKAVAVGARIQKEDTQLKFGRGYDHNFVLNRTGEQLFEAATVVEPVSGRKMQVFTSEPGVQFYSGNFLDGSLTGKDQRVYEHRYGFCLETQHFPDTPNQPGFPSVILEPGQTYQSTTVYKFSLANENKK
ncbi:aldose epimerase family protein [Rapidithrix thailandica]|uniref:Aldose 1-epimerase n=1 Tax=Rapidithrix thailandica TaxID=413964 RepID=A0AAW9S356_9BACT